jgi:hypothetical protein
MGLNLMKNQTTHTNRRVKRITSGPIFVKFGENLSASECAVYPFRKGATLLSLGEIRNMPGHCAVIEIKTGKVHVGYHCDIFTEIPESET